MAVLGVVALVSLTRLSDSVEHITKDSLPGVFNVGRITALAKDQRANMIAHIASSDPTEMATLEAELARVDAELRTALAAYEKTVFTDRDRELFVRFDPTQRHFMEVWSRVLPLSKAGQTKEALELWFREGAPAGRERAKVLDDLAGYNKSAGDENSAQATSMASAARNTILVVFVIALALSIALAIFNVRSIVKPLDVAITRLRDGATQVSSAAQQVANASQTLAQGASQQAASVEETSASTEEINAMARKNSDSAGAAASEVDAVSCDIGTANRNLGSMTESMQGIEAAAAKMQSIIQVIDQIAFQTNILALNAAVEAARAGDAGMGFAVVAGEVRTLAQRSADSARDTARLIEEAITTSQAGVKQLDMLTTSVRTITERSIKLKDLVEQVTRASHEQARGAQEIAGALAQMDSATQNVAANAEESAAASEQLSGQARSLMDVVHQLEGMVTAK